MNSNNREWGDPGGYSVFEQKVTLRIKILFPGNIHRKKKVLQGTL